MKRLRSSDDLSSNGEKGAGKDWGKRDEESGLQRSSSHRSFYYKSESGRKGISSSSSSRYDRVDDDRESSRSNRKQHDGDSYERRKSYDRYKDSSTDKVVTSSSPRGNYGGDRNHHRAESFSVPRRDFPKGFRSERDRSRREGSVSSWRRFNGDETRSGNDSVKVIKTDLDDVSKVKSPQRLRDVKSPVLSKDSGSERSKSVEKKSEDVQMESGAHSSEMEEGELEPDPNPLPISEDEVKKSEEKELNDETLIMTKENSSSAEKTEHEENQGEGKSSENVELVEKEVNEFPSKENVDEHAYVDKALESEQVTKEDKSSDLEDKDNTNNTPLPILDKEIIVETEVQNEEITRKVKDKGKAVIDSLVIVKIEENGRESELEEPISRGLELFNTNPTKKPEKGPEKMSQNDENLALDLSLSLPNVLLPIGSNTPGSPSRAKSSQSFRSSFKTSSDGFTTSFSGSHNFTHNPSCSLTHNDLDNCEKSVGSRPIFQGVDWQNLSSNENTTKEGQIFQNMFTNVDSRVQQWRNKHLPGVQSSPTHSVGSYEPRSEYNKEKKHLIRENSSGTLYKINSLEKKEKLTTVGPDFAESIITMVVSEPLNIVTRKFNEMTDHQIAYVKESTREILVSHTKQWQLSTLQKALRNRTDVTLETLLKLHQTQLEILVSLKTGLQEFLNEIPVSDLAEIYMNMKCRNLNCRSVLPVDECDCKICNQKSGFCSACMCLVCSKFDQASNTCIWVGCDVCLHWCHADCGLQRLYIRNGKGTTNEAQGTTEMQFHCVACNHPSEMFGFVKEVFQNFAKGWNKDTLFKELEYVRRIFSGSEDLRGKQLHELAIQMRSKLENKADLQLVQNQIMGFLNDPESMRSSITPVGPREELLTRYDHHHEGNNGIAGSSQGPEWLKSITSDKNYPNPQSRLSSDIMLQKEIGVFDEIESMMRIKNAEAKMFQTRADDARREAEAIKQIAHSKNQRIEEEYTNRITKLRLNEADELRRQKVEELQGVERAYQEYFHMKMRMESDIKDLLLKMEATRRNLAM